MTSRVTLRMTSRLTYSAAMVLAICHLAVTFGTVGPYRTGLRARLEQPAKEVCSCKEQQNNTVIKIGFLCSYITNKVILGAIPLAVHEVNEDPDLLPGKTLDFVPADTGDASKGQHRSRAIQRMTAMRDDGVMAFIGPGESCVNEALVAAAWNLPLITYQCSDRRVSDKETYPTTARTRPPSTKISKSVVSLLLRFGWDRIVMVRSTKKEWSMIADAIRDLALAHAVDVHKTHDIRNYLSFSHEETLKEIAQTRESTRVYVFVGEHILLVDFVQYMYVQGDLSTGKYAIIAVDDEIYVPDVTPEWYMVKGYANPLRANGTLDAEALKNIYEPWRSVLKLTPSHPTRPDYTEIMNKIKNASQEDPFNVPIHPNIFKSIKVPVSAAHAYDAVLMYARALTEVLAAKEDPTNGTAVLQRIRGHNFMSLRGYTVHVDENGDAEGNYSVVSLLPDESGNSTLPYRMLPVGYFSTKDGQNVTSGRSSDLPEFKYLDPNQGIQWVLGHPPEAHPPCGFDGERCSVDPDPVSIVLLTLAVCVALVAAIFAFRHYRHELKLACLLWKIDMRNVQLLEASSSDNFGGQPFKPAVGCIHQRASHEAGEEARSAADATYCRIGIYKGTIVAVKFINKKSVDLTRSIRKELKLIRELRHDNLLPFLGASLDPGQVCVLEPYCARGSLRDILNNHDVVLDNMFVASLIFDLLKGMIYLHDSEIISHGGLRSSKCLVDSRWVLQITGHGLHEFKGTNETNKSASHQALWKAPELLRNPGHPPRGTQKGDVYSFGIILYEVVGRKGPWGDTTLSLKEIQEQLILPGLYGDQPLRPDTDRLNCPEYVIRCMRDCWREVPDERPDFRLIRLSLKEMQAGLKPNIFDNMLELMEKYSYNLEGLVQERTHQLMEEKKKTEELLYRMLPRTVAESLKRGEPVLPEHFDSVTLCFSDIVGFTALSATSTPLQVVDLLNDLYTCFDSIIGHYDVYKVETIGDAYVAVSGLPVRNGDKHASEIASMALHLMRNIRSFEILHRPGELLKVRMGIHTGPVVAGVVGLKMPRYCLFGDTVNTCSRMESTSEALQIHVSASHAAMLQRLGGFVLQYRGEIAVKGKGQMQTYWLTSEEEGGSRLRPRLTSVPSGEATDRQSPASAPERPSPNGLVRLPPTPSLVPPSPTCKIPCATCRSEREADNTWREKALNGDALFRERSWSFNLFDNAHQVYKTSATKQSLISKLTKKPRSRTCAVSEVRGSDSCSLRALLSPSEESAWPGAAAGAGGRRISNNDAFEMHEHQTSLRLLPAPTPARPPLQPRESVLTVSERSGAACRPGPSVSLIRADVP